MSAQARARRLATTVVDDVAACARYDEAAAAYAQLDMLRVAGNQLDLDDVVRLLRLRRADASLAMRETKNRLDEAVEDNL